MIELCDIFSVELFALAVMDRSFRVEQTQSRYQKSVLKPWIYAV